jgi:hypothetical protein
MPTGIEDMLIRLRELAPDPLIARSFRLLLTYALYVRSKTFMNACSFRRSDGPLRKDGQRGKSPMVLDRNSGLSIRADVRSGHVHEQSYCQSAVSFASETGVSELHEPDSLDLGTAIERCDFGHFGHPRQTDQASATMLKRSDVTSDGGFP